MGDERTEEGLEFVNSDDSLGLSSQNTNFVVTLIALVILIFGPIEPYGMIIRISYLIGIPTIIWFSLWYWGKRWNIDSGTNDHINRTLWGAIAGALLVGAYLSFTSNYHTVCDKYIQTHDGQECIGDYISVPGGDYVETFMLILLAATAFLGGGLGKKSD